MTNKASNIKTYSRQLWAFTLINVFVYVYYFIKVEVQFSLSDGVFYENLIKSGVIIPASTLVIFILNGLLTSNLKAILVFWRVTDVYPGCRVFSRLINKDSRIDRLALSQVYGDLPTEPDLQNKLWYKIYKKYEFDPMVFQSHRNFLLSRDLTSLGFLFFIIYSIASVISMFVHNASLKSLLFYVGYLALQYIILAHVSRIYGNRFVCNVLAKASNTPQ